MAVSTKHLQMTDKDRRLYHAICGQRQREYAAHIATMEIPTALSDWAADMAARFGPVVRVHAHIVDWITALMIVQYGEAVECDPGTIKIHQYDEDGAPKLDKDGEHVFEMCDGWPAFFTHENIARAEAWRNGSLVPGAVEVLGRG